MGTITIIEGERRLHDSYGWSESEKLCIALLSDIHISGGNSLHEDIQSRVNFEKTLEHVVNEKPELIVLAGDLGQREGCVQSYSWIKRQLESTSIPYLIIPGNHDENGLLEQIFPEFSLSQGKLYYYATFGHWCFAFLDSSPDSISENQLEWLDSILERSGEDSRWVLVIHHPPITCGCNYMDSRYPLKNNGSFLKILDKYKQIKHIFCGHYHTSKSIAYSSNTLIHITPSTWFQIDENEPEFTVGDRRFGYRKISLNGEKLYTSVIMVGRND